MGVPHLADRLDEIWDLAPSMQPHLAWTAEAVVERLEMHFQVKTTVANLRHLRSGRRDNPSAQLLWGISQVFDVPVEIFFDDDVAAKHLQAMRTHATLRNPETLAAIDQLVKVTSGSQLTVEAVIAKVQAELGLPTDEDPIA